MIHSFRVSSKLKIHLTIKIKFVSSKVKEVKQLIHSKIDNKEITIDNNTDKISTDSFNSLLHRYQIGLEES